MGGAIRIVKSAEPITGCSYDHCGRPCSESKAIGGMCVCKAKVMVTVEWCGGSVALCCVQAGAGETGHSTARGTAHVIGTWGHPRYEQGCIQVLYPIAMRRVLRLEFLGDRPRINATR